MATLRREAAEGTSLTSTRGVVAKEVSSSECGHDNTVVPQGVPRAEGRAGPAIVVRLQRSALKASSSTPTDWYLSARFFRSAFQITLSRAAIFAD
jgi:hypothetical protein